MRKFSCLIAIVVGCFLGTVASSLIINPQTAIAAASGNPSVIKANRIELVDTKGNKRASLELEDNEQTAALHLWDSNEKLLLSLKASQDSSALLMNKKGKPILALGFEKEQGSMISLSGSKNENGIWMNASENGGLVMVYGKDDKQKVIVAD